MRFRTSRSLNGNSPGTRILYASESLALAALEILVQIGSAGWRVGYSSIPIDFKDDRLQRLDASSLPANWRESPAPSAVQARGDSWARSGASLILRVPSVIIPKESNFLINPSHPEFASLKTGSPEPFEFDPGLLP